MLIFAEQNPCIIIIELIFIFVLNYDFIIHIRSS